MNNRPWPTDNLKVWPMCIVQECENMSSIQVISKIGRVGPIFDKLYDIDEEELEWDDFFCVVCFQLINADPELMIKK